MAQHSKLFNRSILPLLLRIGLGILFIAHGLPKLTSAEMFTGFFASLGFSAWMVTLTGLVEVVGGAFLLLGTCTRHASFVLSILMLVIIFKVHWVNGYSAMNNGYEYQLLILLGALGLFFSGPGKYSLRGRGNCECKNGTCAHK